MLNLSNIGIVLNHLSSSELNYYIVRNLEQIKNKYDIVIFYENLTPSFTNFPCATIGIHELYTFEGIVITTSVEQTMQALHYPTRNLVNFLINDLHWLRTYNPIALNYEYSLAAYLNSFMLFTTAAEYVHPIWNYCNRQPVFMKTLNLKFMVEEIRKCYQNMLTKSSNSMKLTNGVRTR